MYCKNCGRENKDDMSYCGYCGNKLPDPASSAAGRRENDDKKTLTAARIIAAAILITAFPFLYEVAENISHIYYWTFWIWSLRFLIITLLLGVILLLLHPPKRFLRIVLIGMAAELAVTVLALLWPSLRAAFSHLSY